MVVVPGADRPLLRPGLGYSVPYTVYSSGVGWRDDLVASTDAPDARDPFAILWNDRYRGRLGVYDAYLEALSLALIRDGVVDLKAATDADLEGPRTRSRRPCASRISASRSTAPRKGSPRGEFIAHQAWSGDVLAAPRYADRYEPGAGPASPESSATVCRRARPRRGLRPDGGLREGRNPVLAHAFVDHLLDFDTAMDNFAWNGYSPAPRRDRGRVRRSLLPLARGGAADLPNAILSEEAFAGGQMLVEVRARRAGAWLDQWNRVVPLT